MTTAELDAEVLGPLKGPLRRCMLHGVLLIMAALATAYSVMTENVVGAAFGAVSSVCGLLALRAGLRWLVWRATLEEMHRQDEVFADLREETMRIADACAVVQEFTA